MEYHTIEPVYNEKSKILILGSFPSVKSREAAFFYAHPQNRFWRVLAALFDSPCPQTTEEKRTFLLANGIAVWDVIAQCEIVGSSDSSISDVTANDLGRILSVAPIAAIFTNGAKADALYQKHCRNRTGMDAVRLPSTSPANAACSLEQLIAQWKIIQQSLL